MFTKRVFGGVFIVGVGLIIAVTSGAIVSAEHAWNSYRWNQSSVPVVLTLGDNFSSPVWNAHLTVAVADWTASSGLSLTEVDGATSGNSSGPVECWH